MSLNLHSVANECIDELNSNVTAAWLASTGEITNPDGTVAPTYATAITVTVQQQALDTQALRHAERLNLQGTLSVIYLNGQAAAVVRLTQQGGDKFVIAGQTWLVVAVPEGWRGPGWSSAIVQLQVLP